MAHAACEKFTLPSLPYLTHALHLCTSFSMLQDDEYYLYAAKAVMRTSFLFILGMSVDVSCHLLDVGAWTLVLLDFAPRNHTCSIGSKNEKARCSMWGTHSHRPSGPPSPARAPTRPPGVSTALSGECRFPGRHTFPRRSQKPPAPRPAISGIVLPVSPRDLRHETNLGCGLEAFQRLTKQQKGEQIAYTHNSCERSG